MPISQEALAHQAASLRSVTAVPRPTPAAPAQGGMEAALRKGLERFKFDDATAGGGDDDTGTSGFGSP
jgi:hypothetical protein